MADYPINPIFLAPIATSSAIAVTLVLWVMSLRKREMSYEIVSDTPLVTFKEDLEPELEIRFRGEPVHDVHLVIIKIANSGNVPIRSSEFEGRLKVVAPKGSRILMAAVEKTHPSNLEERGMGSESKSVIETVSANEIVFRPVLLNGKDYIVSKMLISQLESAITVTGHIEGLHEIRQAKESSAVPVFLANVGAFIMVVTLFFLDPHSLFNNDIVSFLPYLIFFFIGYTMLLCGIYYPKISKKSLKKVVGL